MNIHVRSLDDRTYSFPYSRVDTTLDLKRKVQRKTGLSISEQCLVLGAQSLQDERSLFESGVYEGCSLWLYRKGSGIGRTISVRIVSLDNETYYFPCSVKAKVLDLKFKVQQETGIPAGKQCLVSNSTTMRDEKCLKNYGIQDGCAVMLIRMKSEDLSFTGSSSCFARKTSSRNGKSSKNNSSCMCIGRRFGLRFCMVQEKRITVKHSDNTIYTYCCSYKDTVLKLKRKISQENQLPVDQFRLVYETNTLQDAQGVRDCGIEDGCIVTMIERVRGGLNAAPVPFNHASMESSHNRQFGKNASNYRRLERGFNLEGRCTNKKCEVCGQLAWSNLGFSPSPEEITSRFDTAGFNIVPLLYETPCPLCKKFMDPESIVSCGFYDCRYSYEGYQQCEKSVNRESGRNYANNEFEYHNGAVDGKTWRSLIIVVEPI